MNFNKLLQISIILSLGISAPIAVKGAVLSLDPPNGGYDQGDTFIVNVRINPEEECVNAIKADLDFSKDILEVKDVSKGGSIISFWVKEPEFSNESGTVSFIGGIPGGYCGRLPGDPGESNLIGKIVIQAKKAGGNPTSAQIEFLDTSQVLLNDGLGTPAKLALREASFTVSLKPIGEAQDINEWQGELEKDKTPPEQFAIEISQDPSVFNGRYFITFHTADKQTGIDHYEVKEGEKAWQRAESPYPLEDQKLRSIIKVGAVDKAGNERIIEFTPVPEETPFPWQTIILVLTAGIIAYFILKMKRQKSKIILLFCILFSALFFFASGSSASTLFLAPSLGSFSSGSTFAVSVKVNTSGKAINAAEATLTFDPTKLSVAGISKTSSVFSIWVSEPAFSNTDGTIFFAGGKPSPGFSGSSGTILTITFKGLNAGSANVNFSSASVLADDGLGTNILSNLISGSYTIIARQTATTPQAPSPPASAAPTAGVPNAPAVTSLTHPDENKWYSNANPEFSWTVPSDATAVRLLYDKNPDSTPTVTYEPAVSEKKLEDLADGVYYFHVRFKNSYGWGEISHRKVLIDSTAPEDFQLAIDNKNDPTNPIPAFSFGTKDALSGIKEYEVSINDFKAVVSPEELKGGQYLPPPLAPGEYLAAVKAFDKAGNFSSVSADFKILPIEAPEITQTPISIGIGEPLEIEGKIPPELTAVVYIQKEDGQEPVSVKAKPDSDGKFKQVYDKALPKGNYIVWAQSEDKRGALSLPTEKRSVEVGLPPLLKIGKIALDYLTIMATLIVIIVGALAVIFYAWYRISIWRKRVRKETGEVKENVTKAFHALEEEVEEQIEFLDGKPGLTKDERKVRDKLKEALHISEKFIDKEIKDVEKELE